MIYKDFGDLKLSALGMGTMRLPVTGGSDGSIDETAAREMVALAMKNGVNYYDTAWGYHNGQSELVMGRLLKEYPRESFYLATKFPGYDLGNMDKVEEIFEEQLKKCQVDYFDFYLFHNVCEMNIDAYLDESHGIHSYLMEQKRAGRIRHLGFSAHGSPAVIRRFLTAYGKDMEFGQLQLNYLDWTFQEGKEKVELLRECGIPIWVMEPLRGGQLANKVPEEDAAALAALRPHETLPAWAFRFLQTVPNVTVTLSGMSSLQQVEENLATYREEKPLSGAEWDALLGVAERMLRPNTVPCTACRYCTSHCPQQLDIPALLALYNEHRVTGGGFLAPMVLTTYPEEKKPGACIGGRSCEAVCPQQIKIPEALEAFQKMLG